MVRDDSKVRSSNYKTSGGFYESATGGGFDNHSSFNASIAGFEMAVIDKSSVTLNIVTNGSTTVTPIVGPRLAFFFDSPSITANASMTLSGTAGENVGGWTLGFIQLKYIGTNRAHYRGATVKDGSIMVTYSSKTLCRDTDKHSTEVWYDSINSGRKKGSEGINKLAATSVLGQTGSLNVQARLYDKPFRIWPAIQYNTLIPSRPANYLNYAVIELLFCTMLVARDPAGKFHMLKHFYWNAIWEQKFRRESITGTVVVDQAIRLQHNMQRPARDGNPYDSKFIGKEYDLTLPISETVSNAPAKTVNARDWSQS